MPTAPAATDGAFAPSPRVVESAAGEVVGTEMAPAPGSATEASPGLRLARALRPTAVALPAALPISLRETEAVAPPRPPAEPVAVPLLPARPEPAEPVCGRDGPTTPPAEFIAPRTMPAAEADGCSEAAAPADELPGTLAVPGTPATAALGIDASGAAAGPAARVRPGRPTTEAAAATPAPASPCVTSRRGPSVVPPIDGPVPAPTGDGKLLPA
jgi:hypothetical protein